MKPRLLWSGDTTLQKGHNPIKTRIVDEGHGTITYEVSCTDAMGDRYWTHAGNHEIERKIFESCLRQIYGL